MNQRLLWLLAALAFPALGGCSYAGVAVAGDRVVVLKNHGFGRSAHVCKLTDAGVTECKDNESP